MHPIIASSHLTSESNAEHSSQVSLLQRRWMLESLFLTKETINTFPHIEKDRRESTQRTLLGGPSRSSSVVFRLKCLDVLIDLCLIHTCAVFPSQWRAEHTVPSATSAAGRRWQRPSIGHGLGGMGHPQLLQWSCLGASVTKNASCLL